MIETFHPTPQQVPDVPCEHCGHRTDTQAYSLMIARSKVTREWTFCSLQHLRAWLKPMR